MPEQEGQEQTTGAREERDEQRKISALRTLKSDTSKHIKEKKVSLVDIAVEQAKKERLTVREEKERSNYKKIAVVFLLFVVAGAFLISFLLFRKAPSQPQIEQSAGKLTKPILAANEEIEIIVAENAREEFLNNIKSGLGTPVRINNLLNVLIVRRSDGGKQPISGSDFLGLVGASPPLMLLDSLGENFMLAKFYFTKDWPILIFKVSSYNYAFSGMIKWENAMAEDLKNIFALGDIDKLNAFFEDKEIQNRDTRVLKNEKGDIVLIYSFIGRDYLVITTGEEPLREIFRRFSLSQYIND